MDTTTLLLFILAVVAVAVVAIVVLRSRREPEPRDTATTRAPSRLGRASGSLGAALRSAWGSGLDDESWNELEEALIAADVGVDAAGEIVEGVRSAKPDGVEGAKQELARQMTAELERDDRAMRLTGEPAVILVVGVNGTGKTTTIAKLAARFGEEGKEVVLAAADTFRAAAGTQLASWGDRLGVEVIRGKDGGDPAAVAFDAIASAGARGCDVVIVDTAGRLHGKKNLMAELAKIHRVAAGDRGEVDEVLLVLDATAGQNGIAQVREFAYAVPVSGIVLTKLDGTARGGIVIAVERRLGVPVKLIGLGEGLDDLIPFDPEAFVSELLERA